tara:strand:- start:1413 stop:1532 length:120 start_codon:yes stop_codon:yes gene_type:complete
LYEDSNDEEDGPKRKRDVVKKPKWQLKKEQEYYKAQYVK